MPSFVKIGRPCNRVFRASIESYILLAYLSHVRIPCVCVCGGGGGGVLCSFHTYVGSGHFLGVQNFEFQYFFFFRKMNIFLGMKILWIYFGVITKLDHI